MLRSIALALGLLAGGCSLLTTTSGGPGPGHGPGPHAETETPVSANGNLTVPDLIGRTQEEAVELVKAAGFNHAVETRELDCDGPAKVAGKIHCQDPGANAVVDRYALIQVSVYQPQVFKGFILREQLRTIQGLTPDQAKVALRKLGHDGTVTVSEIPGPGGGPGFAPHCGENKVCSTDQLDVGIHDPLTLYINPTLTIAPP